MIAYSNPQESYQAQRLIHMSNNGVAIETSVYKIMDEVNAKKLERYNIEDEFNDIFHNVKRLKVVDKPYCGFYAVNKEHCVVGNHCAVCKEVV